jgi:hypothetical protein
MWFADVSPATVTNVKNNNYVRFDGEEYAVLMRLVAVKQLAHVERRVGIFRREHTAFGHLGE